MIGTNEIKSVKSYCETVARSLRASGRNDCPTEYEEAAEMLEKATPEALYLLFDTGIFNALVIGYTTEAARIAGLTAKDTKAIREAVRDTLDGMSAEEIERKERKQ